MTQPQQQPTPTVHILRYDAPHERSLTHIQPDAPWVIALAQLSLRLSLGWIELYLL
jgi:hypothetical protein